MPGKQSCENEKALRSRKKTATLVLRIVLGVLFIFSALIKLNDPMGLAFKIEEYLAQGLPGTEFSLSFIVDAAGTLITLELILGASLLLGRFKVFTLWTLLALNAVFTLVTLYSAVTGAVPHCGCFGDAIVLSPWASLLKSLVAVSMIVTLICWQRFIKPAVGFRTSMSVVALLFAFSIGMIYYVLRHEPPMDFRPYKVGVDLHERHGADSGSGENRNIWTYRVEGEERQYRDSDEPWNIPGAEFVSRRNLRTGGVSSAAADFSVTDARGSDCTDSLLALERVWLITCYRIDQSETEAWEAIAALISRENTPAVVLADAADPENLRRRYGIDAPVFFTDPTTLKTILRSNPGVVELRKGVIAAKWGIGDIAALSPGN